MSGLALAAAVGVAATAPADAAVRSGFATNSGSLGSVDDASTSASLGFGFTFGGTTYNDVFVNSNGNLTFDSAFTGFSPVNPLSGMSQPIIAPFFADVDTRGMGAIDFGQGTVDGDNAFAATWTDVGYYMQMDSKANTFQVVLIDRGGGDFDIEFNYDQIEWEVGMFDDSTPPTDDGLGDPAARAGYNDAVASFFELDGSGVAGSFITGGPFDLVANSNVGEDGRYLFQIRNGEITPVDDANPSPVGPDDVVAVKIPEPATLALFGSALLGLGLVHRRRQRRA